MARCIARTAVAIASPVPFCARESCWHTSGPGFADKARKDTMLYQRNISIREKGMTDLEVARELVREGLTALHPKSGLPNYFRAELAFREAVALLRGTEQETGLLLVVAYDNLAWACDAQGREADAESFYLRSLAAQQAADWPPVVCDELTLLKLSQLYARQGNLEMQRATLRKMRSQTECSCKRSATAFEGNPDLERVAGLLK